MKKYIKNQVTKVLMKGCPPEAMADHLAIVEAIQFGRSVDTILNMQETENWPETWHFLNTNRWEP